MLRRPGTAWLGMLLLASLTACHVRTARVLEMQPARSDQARAAVRHVRIGDEYFARHRTAEAVQEWTLAVELEPAAAEARQRLARLARGLDPLATDAASGDSGRDRGGDVGSQIAADLAKCEEYYRQSQLKEARLLWQRVLEMDPGQPAAQAGLQRLDEETYQPDPRRSFDGMTQDLYERGMAAFRRHDWPEAEKLLAEACNLNPQQPQAKRYLERTQAALAERQRQGDIALWQSQAENEERQARWPQARDGWLKIAALAPEHPAAADGLSRCAQALAVWAREQLQSGQEALRQNRPLEAREIFLGVLSVFPDSAEAKNGERQAASVLAGIDRRAQAVSRNRARFNAGAAAFRRGDLAAAVREWEAAVAADPGDLEARDWLAKARADVRAAQEKRRHQADVRYADGLAAYQRGELDEALTCWKEALELDPGHEKARGNIQRVQREMQ